jgi:hypothetical protein
LGLLVAADAISSDGDEQVRNARREFVRTVEGKLGEMEVGRRRVWEKLRGKQVEEANFGDEVKAEDHPATQEEQATTQENKPVETDKEATSEATPIALPSQEPLPTTTNDVTEPTEPSTEHDKPTEPTKSDESIEQATADIESTRPLEDVKAQSADDEDGDVEAGRAFSDSEDEDQKAEDEEKGKKEQVDEFVVV